ncbi:Putative B3 domain-containing protein At5g58280 [Linum perenne]
MAMVSEAVTDNTYEEARKQRLEENRKRFQDLGISDLTRSISKISNSPTANSKQRQPKPRSKPAAALDEFQPRRSSRARNLIVSYVDDFQADLDLSAKRRRSSGSRLNSSWTSYIARPLDEVRLASFEERERARKAAECFEETLPSCHPVFVKSMVRSHVYSCFWLGLPSQFCNNYLPKRDSDIILEDENGSTYDTKYLSERAGLSGGWRGFALERKLNDGDALVFQLVEPERFKVYIFRTSSVSEKKPNAAAVVCKETDDDQQSQKRRKVKEDNENETDKVADDEGAQPKAIRLTGRKTAVKNQMKKNVSVPDSDNDQQGLEEDGLMKDEKDKLQGSEEHQQARRSGRRSTVADETKEKGQSLEGQNEGQDLVPQEEKDKSGTGEKPVAEEAIAAKPAIRARKRAAPKLFRRKL